jgi:hypothetical protein
VNAKQDARCRQVLRRQPATIHIAARTIRSLPAWRDNVRTGAQSPGSTGYNYNYKDSFIKE